MKYTQKCQRKLKSYESWKITHGHMVMFAGIMRTALAWFDFTKPISCMSLHIIIILCLNAWRVKHFLFFCNWWVKTILNFVGHIYRYILFCHPLQVWPATDASCGSTQRDVTHVCSVASLEAAVKKWLSTSTVNTVVTEQLKTQGVGPQTYSVVEFFCSILSVSVRHSRPQ